MPESLQQKVDRMTAGMEVTVTFGGGNPGICAGPLVSQTGKSLYVVKRQVRCYVGRVNPEITAIDMPDPSCPYGDGDAVLIGAGTRAGRTATVTGRMVWCDDHEAWEVEVRFEGGLDKYVPENLTLVSPYPAEPDCPAILVTGVDGISNALTRDVLGRYAALPLSDWLTSSHIATVQALRPAEYLRGGQ